MELALVTLLVIFGLCFTLLTVTELGNALNKRVLEDATERVDLSRIGDLFLSLCSSGRYDSFIPSAYSDRYFIEKSRSEERYYQMKVYSLSEHNLLLCVRCDSDGRVLEFSSFDRSSED